MGMAIYYLLVFVRIVGRGIRSQHHLILNEALHAIHVLGVQQSPYRYMSERYLGASRWYLTKQS